MSEEEKKDVPIKRFRSPSGRKIRECYSIAAPVVALLRELSVRERVGKSQLVEIAVFTYYKEHVGDDQVLANLRAIEVDEMERAAKREMNKRRTEKRKAKQALSSNAGNPSTEDKDNDKEE